MSVKAAFAACILMLLLGGCASLQGKEPQNAASPQAMPLTADNVTQVRQAVDRAKTAAPRPTGRDAYVRYARTVYAAAVPAPWTASATTEVALASAKAGDASAKQYLTVMVYDLQLRAAMEGEGLSDEDWKAVYVGAGIMTDPVFSGYAALSRGGKALP